MPSKRRLKQLKNAPLVAAEQAKKRKIEVNTTLQPGINDQLCNVDTSTSDKDDLEEANGTWFWNFSANELRSDLEEEPQGKGQLDKSGLDVELEEPRSEEAVPLRNAVKEIWWNKERENNLKGSYGKGSRSTNKRQKKATKELEKEVSKTHNIMALWLISIVEFRTLGQLKIKRTPQPFCRIPTKIIPKFYVLALPPKQVPSYSMGRVNARKRKAKAKVVVAATEKAHGKPGKITLKIQQKSSNGLGDKVGVDLGKGLDDIGRQLRPDEEGQQNEDLTELESEDDKFEGSEDKEEEEEEDNEEDEIPAPSPPSKTAIRAKNKRGPPNTKVTIKTTSSSRSIKQPSTIKPSSSSSNSTMRKPVPNMASKHTSKSRQKVIPIVSDSDGDIKEQETRVSDLEISNDEGKRVVKRGAKKCPPERDPEMDIFEFELHWRSHFEEKDVDKNVEFKEIIGISYDL